MSIPKYCAGCGQKNKSLAFVEGMRDQAKSLLQSTRWFQWGYRKELKGFILACSIILGE